MKMNYLDRLDLPEEPGFGETLVEITADRRVLVENHRGVIQYGQTEICVKVKFGVIHICGTDLELTRMSSDQLIVSGCIRGVMLSRRCNG